MTDALLRDLMGAVRELNGTLSGVLRVSARDVIRDGSEVVPFNGTFTTTGSLTIWTPSTGNRATVKRVIVAGVVDTLLAAANPVAFYVADATTGDVIAPISAAAATAAAGTLLPAAGLVTIDLGAGCPASAIDVALVIKANATIGSGVVRFFGVVIGSEAIQ